MFRGVSLGKNSIIAGRGSQFFTHGLSSKNIDDVRPIKIGDWCYVGSNCNFVPGVILSRGIFVGMGSVVTKKFEEEYTLIGGHLHRLKRNYQIKIFILRGKILSINI